MGCVNACGGEMESGIAADFSSYFGSFHLMIMVHPVGMPKSATDSSDFFFVVVKERMMLYTDDDFHWSSSKTTQNVTIF